MRKLIHGKMYVFAPRPCVFQLLITLSVVSYLLLAPSVSGGEPGTPSMAFLAVDDVAGRWVTLFEGTRETDGSLLLDRGATDALLKERSILLQATGADEERIDLRQWVSADLLVVVETVEGGDDPGDSDLVWFRALDVVTGVRLVDEIVPVDLKQPEDGLDAIDELLREHILPSWRTLWGQEKKFAGVSLLDIRLVDAGTEDRQTFATLYRLLQRMILHDPSMVLLERNLLDVLVTEEALSPTLQLNLQAGVVLLSGSVHQETGGAVFTLRGATPSNQNVFEETFLLDGSVHPADLAKRALDLLSQHFSRSDSSYEPNLQQETRRFHQLAHYYFVRKDLDRALDTAFTARALAPEDPLNTRSLYTMFYERVMTQVKTLQAPDSAVLSNLLDEIHHLFQYLPTLAQPHYDRTSGKNLLSTVRSRFGETIESDPELQAQWRQIEAMYHRSLENVYMRESITKSGSTEYERDNLITSLLNSYRPVQLAHLKLIFGKSRNGNPLCSTPVPLEDLVQLMEIMKNRPYVSNNFHRKHEAPFDPIRDDVYIRNLVLSALSFVAGKSDESWKDHTIQAMQQCALLIIENPLLWTRNHYRLIWESPPAYRVQLRTVFADIRQQVEDEGWFVPELYFLDDWESKPGVMAKAVDPSLRLISTADKSSRHFSKREELTHRLYEWFEPGTLRRAQPDFPDQDFSATDYEDILTERRKVRTHPRDYHGVIWGPYLVAHVKDAPIGEHHAEERLQVYEKTPAGIQQVKTVEFPLSGVETRIDDFNEKEFYQALLGGNNHLYYSHQHSLYQFDEEMNPVRILNLKEWNFPEYMVANLLETSQGVLLVLTKRHLHKQFDALGRYSGGSINNAGGVLVLATDNLEPIQILANIERPTPQNDLEAAGPFDVSAMVEQEDGTILLAATRGGHTRWYEIGEDAVPRKRKMPGQAELIRAWAATFKPGTDWDSDFMESFCRTHRKAFGLKNRVRPGMRLDNSFEFRQVVPFGDGVLILGSAPGDTANSTAFKHLFFMPKDGKPNEARLIMKLTGKEHFNSLTLWEEDVVLTGRHPQHRVIRKQAIEAFLSAENRSSLDQTPFPDSEHLTEQKAMQKRFSARVKPFVSPESYLTHPGPLDLLVHVPGGDFLLRGQGGDPAQTVSHTFPDLYISETKVTFEEFYRVYKWAIHNGYRFSEQVDAYYYLDEQVDSPTRPATDLLIVDTMLYCNARSEWEGLKPAYYLDQDHQTVLRTRRGNDTWNKVWTNEHVDWNAGYRLPTEAEWERLARGADPDHTARFPWGDSLSHDLANYLASDFHAFDLSSGGLHPDVAGQHPPITPVKTFPPHGFENRFYGLAGNVAEIVWDRREWEDGTDATEAKRPRRPMRYKGGSWAMTADACTIRTSWSLDLNTIKNHGFRVVLPGALHKRIEK